jgi:hypothetical protein
MQGRHQRPIWPASGRFMGNIGTETESMEQPPDCATLVPVAEAPLESHDSCRHKRHVSRAGYYDQYERSSVRY